MEQRTEEWFEAKLGKASASRLEDLMARTKSGYSATRRNYMAELLIERLTGKREEGYESPAMRWGTETEPLAIAAYEIRTGVMIDRVGFVDHPAIPWFGASPDALVGEDGGLEVKCPNTATHLDTLLGAPPPRKYVLQCHGGMMCTGRDWWDLVSYDPRLPEHLCYHVHRIRRDESLVAEIEREVKRFLTELEDLEKSLNRLPGKTPVFGNESIF